MPLLLAKACNDLLSFGWNTRGRFASFWRGVSCRGKKVLLSDPNAVSSGVAGENLQGKLSTVTDCLCNHLKVVENCFELTRV